MINTICTLIGIIEHIEFIMVIPLVVKVFSNYIIEHYAVTPCNHWGVFREVLLYAQFVSLFYTFRGIYYLK